MANDIKQITGFFGDFFQLPSKFPALLSVTTHTLNKSFDRLDNVLVTIPMEREHAGARTAEMLIHIKANLNKLKLAPSTQPDKEEIK
uniref:Uncharacterized protein n=1 Tax=Ditylenchus dipsaci TaxID=166011 RepID=A0A915D4D2_9BILA